MSEGLAVRPVEAMRHLVDLGVAVHESGLELTDPAMTYEAWEEIGRWLGRVDRWTRFAVGDWVLFGAEVFGEDSAQAFESTTRERYDEALRVTGFSSERLRKITWVCQNVARVRRRTNLPFSLHEAVASLPPVEQEEWLRRAEAEAWSERDLRHAIREGGEPKPLQPSWSERAPLADDEREVIQVYRELRERFPRLVTPERAREALERQVVVDARPTEPTLAASAVPLCPACGQELEPTIGPEGPREE